MQSTYNTFPVSPDQTESQPHAATASASGNVKSRSTELAAAGSGAASAPAPAVSDADARRLDIGFGTKELAARFLTPKEQAAAKSKAAAYPTHSNQISTRYYVWWLYAVWIRPWIRAALLVVVVMYFFGVSGNILTYREMKYV